MGLSSGLMTKDDLSCFVVAVMECPKEGNLSEKGIISASGLWRASQGNRDLKQLDALDPQPGHKEG